MLITVFTPTYNRAHLLPVLYGSLCGQIFSDFEWLIVDDGSTDNTKDIIDSFIKEKKIRINYFWKENGGKHKAINYGVPKAGGELFFIVDSDDKLPSDALKIVADNYEFIRGKNDFAGVCGLKAYFNGDLLPGIINYDVLECKGIDYHYRRGANRGSDIAEYVVRTEVLKEFKFPEYEDENFCAESAVWNPIGNNYKYRYINKVIYLCEFLEDGLSANSLKSRMRCPLGAMSIYKGLCSCNIPIKYKVKSAINYWRFFFCSKKRKDNLIKVYYWPLFPIGFVMHLRDKRLVKKRLRIGRERKI